MIAGRKHSDSKYAIDVVFPPQTEVAGGIERRVRSRIEKGLASARGRSFA